MQCPFQHDAIVSNTFKYMDSIKDRFHLAMTSKTSYQVFLQTQVPQFKHLLYCIEKGYYQAVHVLLTHYKANTAQQYYFAFAVACKVGHGNILKLLLDHHKDNIPRVVCNLLCKIASDKNNTDIILTLLQDKRANQIDIDQLFIRACKSGNERLFQYLIYHYQVKPDMENNTPIHAACKAGNVNIVKWLLQHDSVDPSVESYLALFFAIQEKHEHIVKLLLQDSRMTNVGNLLGNNSPLAKAIRTEHSNILILLIQDERIHPTIGEVGMIFSIACENNSLELLKALRIKVKHLDQYIPASCKSIIHVIENGYYEVCEWLLQEGLMVYNHHYVRAVKTAYKKGHFNIVCLFASNSMFANAIENM
jgi:ankyrin repeat protein